MNHKMITNFIADKVIIKRLLSLETAEQWVGDVAKGIIKRKKKFCAELQFILDS